MHPNLRLHREHAQPTRAGDPNEVLFCYPLEDSATNRVSITRFDHACLGPREQLSDNVVDWYLRWEKGL